MMTARERLRAAAGLQNPRKLQAVQQLPGDHATDNEQGSGPKTAAEKRNELLALLHTEQDSRKAAEKQAIGTPAASGRLLSTVASGKKPLIRAKTALSYPFSLAETGSTGDSTHTVAQGGWVRLSHHRIDDYDRPFHRGVLQDGRDVLHVRPPKQPWTLKPLKTRSETPAGEKQLAAMKGMKSMKHLPGIKARSTRTRPAMAYQEWKIYTVKKEILTTAADPMGDCSWTLPFPKTYEVLPDLAAKAGDWDAFKSVMTDLLFLWRKVQGGNPLTLLQIYEEAGLTLFAKGLRSERLEDFRNFFFHHLRHLAANPNLMFGYAAVSQNRYVKQSLNQLLQKAEHFVQEVRAKVNAANQVSGLTAENLSPRRKDKSVVSLTRGQKAVLHDKCMELLAAQNWLHAIQQNGLLECMSQAKRDTVYHLSHELIQKVQFMKALLREMGVESFHEVTERFLKIHRAGPGAAGEDQFRFGEFVNLWSENDSAFASLSVYIPPKVYSNAQKMKEFEETLCRQVATAAKVDADLVDLVSLACDPAQEKSGMNAKALLKLMGHVTGLEVTVVGGKYWPGGDSMSKANLVVGVKLVSGKQRGKEGKPSPSIGYLARKLQAIQQFTASRAGEINPVNPKFIDEVFQVLIYAKNQNLVITAYEQDKGTRSPIGEFTLKVDDVLRECRNSAGMEFQRSYGMVKSASLKPVYYRNQGNDQDANTNRVMRQSEIVVKLKYFTHPAKHAPHKMAEYVMKDAERSSSTLRQGLIVEGPAFHDLGNSWETVTIYVCSDYHEMRSERAFLERFVFPALACRCQELKVHFKWVDLSDYGQPGTRDDVAKRIHAIQQATIRGYDQTGQMTKNTLFLSLLGEKRGRILEQKDFRRLSSEETVPGQYKWIIDGAKGGMSVLEMEMKAAILTRLHQCDPIVCIRNPAFLDDPSLICAVPKLVRGRYMETNPISKAKMTNLKAEIVSKLPGCIVRYRPSFHRFTPSGGEQHPDLEQKGDSSESNHHSSSTDLPEVEISSKNNDGNLGDNQDDDPTRLLDGEIFLGNLETFGLHVFERIWGIISERYSFSRSHTRINLYGEEASLQADQVRALCKSQFQAQDGTQEAVVKALHDVSDFLKVDHGEIAYLVGPHGCGKSTLLARFIASKDLVDVTEVIQEVSTGMTGEKSLKSYVSKVINILRVTSRSTGRAAAHTMSSGEWTRIRKKLAAIHALKSVPQSDPLPGESASFATPADLADAQVGRENFSAAALESEALEDSQDPANLKFAELDAPSKVDRAAVQKVLDDINILVERQVPSAEIAFRIQSPFCVFFIKSAAHTTNHMLSHLCSSLLRHQDAQPPSWRRLEDILRHQVTPADLSSREPLPILIILDNISTHERNEVQRIVMSFQGRVRAILSVDQASLQHDEQSSNSGPQRSRTNIAVPSLGYSERKQILDHLIDRIGPKKKPSNTNAITDRVSAGSPLYLRAVAGYLSACIVLNCHPESLSDLGNDTVSIISHQFLPMVERAIGLVPIDQFVAIMMSDSFGHDRRELRVMMHSCGTNLTDSQLRLMMEAFRPFADTSSFFSEDHVAITRASMREACIARYAAACSPAKSTDIDRPEKMSPIRLHDSKQVTEELSAMNEAASKQDLRIARQILKSNATMDEPTACADSDGEWFSEDEGMDDCHRQAPPLITDELELKFGRATIVLNRDLFFKWCVSDSQFGGERDFSMDLAELSKMLRIFEIYPNYVSKPQIIKAFQSANSNPNSRNGNRHEMDFQEFMDCMQHMHRSYMAEESHGEEDKIKAALLIQSKHRGDKVRKDLFRLKCEISARKKGHNQIEVDEENEAMLIKVQAQARARSARLQLKRKIAWKAAAKIPKKRPAWKRPPCIRGRTRSDGALAVIQARLKACFNSVVEAFVFIDLDGNGSISKAEFSTGMKNLMVPLDGDTVQKVCAVVAGVDHLIDCFEFLRTFAWEDVIQLEEALHEAKVSKSTIAARAKERLVAFFGRTVSEESTASSKFGRTSSFDAQFRREELARRAAKEARKALEKTTEARKLPRQTTFSFHNVSAAE